MSNMARYVRGRMRARCLLALLAIIAVLALVGHFVGDAASLWLETTSRLASSVDFQNTSASSQDAAASLHTGFAVAVVLAVMAPVFLSISRVEARLRPVYRFFSPPHYSSQKLVSSIAQTLIVYPQSH